jgi:hypothetical protein
VRAPTVAIDQVLINLVLSARDAINGRGAIEIATRNEVVEGPLASVGAPIPSGEYAVIEVKHWDGRSRSTDSQKLRRGSTVGPGVAFEAITSLGGYMAYAKTCSEMSALHVFLPAAPLVTRHAE